MSQVVIYPKFRISDSAEDVRTSIDVYSTSEVIDLIEAVELLPGADGDSAYQVAVDNGFIGDETAWLVSLIGDDGATGATGDAGPNEVTTSTSTDLTGILKGNGSIIGVAIAGTDYATASHTHLIANVTGLQDALDGKQATGDYATGAEGDLASSALQPSDITSGTITAGTGDINFNTLGEVDNSYTFLEVTDGEATALTNSKYIVNIWPSNIVVTLPVNAIDGDSIDFVVFYTTGGNTLTFASGTSESVTLDTIGEKITLIWDDGNSYWIVIKPQVDALQPGDVATVATTGDYSDLINLPTLGTASAENVSYFALAAQGALADSALQPADIGTSVQGYDADTAKLDTQQEWSASQYADASTLTDDVTIAWDMATTLNDVSVTLGGNRTLGAPTNVKVGQKGVIRVIQDGTGSRTLTFNSAFKFPSGTAPTLTTTAGAVDRVYYHAVSLTRFECTAILDFN